MDAIKTVAVRAKPGVKDIFAYKMYHTFVSFAGIGRILFSAIFIALGIGTAGSTETYLTVLMIAIGLLNVLVTPLLFLFQSAKAAGSNSPITYTFTEEKILANDGKKRAELNWGGLALVVWLRRELLIYTTPYEALVLPRRQMEGKDSEILDIIEKSATPNRKVIRKFL